jgi:hypothetical protein
MGNGREGGEGARARARQHAARPPGARAIVGAEGEGRGGGERIYFGCRSARPRAREGGRGNRPTVPPYSRAVGGKRGQFLEIYFGRLPARPPAPLGARLRRIRVRE